jgi:hypothetical protein
MRASFDLIESTGVVVVGGILLLNIPETWDAASTRFHDKELIAII